MNDNAYQFSAGTEEDQYVVTFLNKKGETVGLFDFSGSHLAFAGNPEQGAQAFIEWAKIMFEERLKKEYQRGYEDCLTDEGKK